MSVGTFYITALNMYEKQVMPVLVALKITAKVSKTNNHLFRDR